MGSNCVSATLVDTRTSASVLSRSSSPWLAALDCLGLSHLIYRHECLIIHRLVINVIILFADSLLSLVLHLASLKNILRHSTSWRLSIRIQVNCNNFCFHCGWLILVLDRSLELLPRLFMVFFCLISRHLELSGVEDLLSCFNHGVSNCFLRGSRRYRGGVSFLFWYELFLARLLFEWLLEGRVLPGMMNSLISLDISFRGNVQTYTEDALIVFLNAVVAGAQRFHGLMTLANTNKDWLWGSLLSHAGWCLDDRFSRHTFGYYRSDQLQTFFLRLFIHFFRLRYRDRRGTGDCVHVEATLFNPLFCWWILHDRLAWLCLGILKHIHVHLSKGLAVRLPLDIH